MTHQIVPGDLNEGLLESGEEHGHDSKGGGGCFEYIIAIRLPAAVKDKEKGKFKEYMAHNYPAMSVKEVLERLIVNPVARKAAIVSCGDADDLPGALNCVIGMILSLFETLGSSQDCHFEVVKFNSIEVNKLFICTRMSTKLAEVLADMAEYPVQLSAEGIEKLGIKITDQTNLIPAYVKYDEKQQEDGLLLKHGGGSILRHIDRIRLLYDKITDYIEIWDVAKMFQPQNITFKMYPAHEENDVEWLRVNWASMKHFLSWNQPTEKIREYFGEAVAFYFLFDNFMRRALLILFVLMLPLRPWYGISPWVDSAYSFLVIAWFTIVLKSWQRTEAYHANIWGTDYTHSGSTVKHRVNPDFEGLQMPLVINENMQRMTADPSKRKIAVIRSTVVTCAFILLALACVVVNRLYAANFPIIAPYASALLAVQIKIFDMIWQKIGPWLAALEEHTELQDLEQSMSLKYSIFLFFNTFQGFLWIAYVEPHRVKHSCTPAPECYRTMLTSSIEQAFPILILFAGLGLAFPWYQIWGKYKKQEKDLKAHPEKLTYYPISSFEEQTKKMEYLGEDSMYDYTQVISAMAFVALFATCAPLTVVALAYFAVTVQHRVDANRLCILYQRTYPDRGSGIGIWFQVMTFMKYASVVNCCGLLSTNPRVNLAVLFGILDPNIASMARQNSTLISQNETQAAQIAEEVLWLGNMFAFVMLLSCTMLFVLAVEKFVDSEGPIVKREKARQAHQRAKLFDFENSTFSEKVVMQGSSNFKEDNYDKIAKLEPGDPRYVAPIKMC